MATIKASELEAGDVIVRHSQYGARFTVTLSYTGTRMMTTGAEATPVGLIVDWEGTSQYGTPRMGVYGPDEMVEVTSR